MLLTHKNQTGIKVATINIISCIFYNPLRSTQIALWGNANS